MTGEHTTPEDGVTEPVTASEEVVTESVTGEKPDTRVVRLNVTDIDRIMERGYADEKPATVLHRLLDEVDELRQGNAGAGTAIIPGQQSFSIKDAVDSLRGVCDDDTVCLKFAAKMVETQAAATNSRLEREHRAEQQRLDREDKEKDRALKKELAASRAEHDKDLTMIKKGMIKESDLEDIVFLGQKNTSPADRIKNKKELAARVAASEEEEFGDADPPEMDI